jgi:hypothetical protein
MRHWHSCFDLRVIAANSQVGSASVKIGHELDFALVATETATAPSLIGAGIDDKWGGLTETSAAAPVPGIGCNVAGRIAPVASTLTEQAPNRRHHPKVDQDGGRERDQTRSSSQGFDQCRRRGID